MPAVIAPSVSISPRSARSAGSDAASSRKILFFYQDFGAMGGIERYLLHTTQALQNTGAFRPVVVCCAETPLFHALKAANVTVYGLSSPCWFGKSFWRSLDVFSWRALHRILRAERPDLAHVHLGLLELGLLKAWGYPVAYTFHGYGTLFSLEGEISPLKRGFKRLSRFLFRQTVARMDAFWVVSEAEQARLLEEGYLSPAKPGVVMHNGLPTVALAAQAAAVDTDAFRAQWNIPLDAHCISYIGRLDDNKNPADFLALAECAAWTSGATPHCFLMAGDGPLVSLVQAACARLPQLRYLGHQADITPMLAVSSLIVAPALREGFGLGLLEAMAAGVPCLAYDTGAAMELLNTPALSVCRVPMENRVGNREGLIRQASALLAQSCQAREALAQALRHRAADFDESRFLKRLTAEYGRLMPLVSVILPVYNGETSVVRAIRSVLTQTYPHLELIVVDDGSTDGTGTVLARIADPRLTVLSQSNQGVAMARNHGFANASGSLIAFIDADDVWFRQKLSVELAVYRRYATVDNPACLVYSGYDAVDELGRLINRPPVSRHSGDLSEAVLEEEGIFLPSTSLVHRQVVEALGGFDPHCYHEDRVFFIRACQRFPAYPTGRRLVAYRQTLSGRCRSVLKDFDRALAAELSIVQSLQGDLSEAKLGRLSILQLRNLLFRMLMYNEPGHARAIHRKLQAQPATENLFRGKKGQLALLSLRTRINFLAGARLLVQCLFRLLSAPCLQWRWGTGDP